MRRIVFFLLVVSFLGVSSRAEEWKKWREIRIHKPPSVDKIQKSSEENFQRVPVVEDVFQKGDWISAVVRVSMRNTPTLHASGVSAGTGTLTHSDGRTGYIITNRHVVGNYPWSVVRWLDGRISYGRVYYIDDVADFALILVSTEPDMYVLPLAQSAEYPAKGELVWMSGYGGGSGKITRWQAKYLENDADWVRHTDLATNARSINGDSGGSLVHLSPNGWRQIGVHWGRRGNRKDRAHAVSSTYVLHKVGPAAGERLDGRLLGRCKFPFSEQPYEPAKHPGQPGVRPPQGTILPLPDAPPQDEIPLEDDPVPPAPEIKDLSAVEVELKIKADEIEIPLNIISGDDPIEIPLVFSFPDRPLEIPIPVPPVPGQPFTEEQISIISELIAHVSIDREQVDQRVDELLSLVAQEEEPDSDVSSVTIRRLRRLIRAKRRQKIILSAEQKIPLGN